MPYLLAILKIRYSIDARVYLNDGYRALMLLSPDRRLFHRDLIPLRMAWVPRGNGDLLEGVVGSTRG